MTNYECCYSSGRQFVFTERLTWKSGQFLMVAFFGMLTGLLVSMTVCFGGVLALDVILSTAAACVLIRVFVICFFRTSSSVDSWGYVIICSLFAAFVSAVWGLVRYLSLFDLSAYGRCVLFGVLGAVVGLTIYVFVLACTQEDERKHHLFLCSPTGDALAKADGSPLARAEASRDAWTALTRYLELVSKTSLLTSAAGGGLDGCLPSDCINVHNRTLKLIKVCLYASDDVFCWVPLGGISGHCVGFIHAEQCRAFSPAKNSQITSSFKLKVFQPGLFDKELACFPQAQLGQSFTFHDVEGMVKRSRSLSSDKLKHDPMRLPVVPHSYVESSESEFEGLMRVAKDNDPNFCLRKTSLMRRVDTESKDLDSSGPMKRNRSIGTDLSSSRSTGKDHSPKGSPTEGRRAAPHEVVVRNRSNQDIRVLLFRSTDYYYVVPLVGHLVCCGDIIPPDCERRFNPNGDKDFTVKVYSVGPGAKELTYLTVERGQAYTFCDSLLS